jgi:hypothetical protein
LLTFLLVDGERWASAQSLLAMPLTGPLQNCIKLSAKSIHGVAVMGSLTLFCQGLRIAAMPAEANWQSKKKCSY